MSYSDFKSVNRFVVSAKISAALGTTTASGTAAIASGYTAPLLLALPRRVQVTKVTLIPTTIPNAASTVLKGSFLNGTATFATVALTTGALGTPIQGTVTATNAIMTASTQPTFVLEGTATASGSANGTYDIYFEATELYA